MDDRVERKRLDTRVGLNANVKAAIAGFAGGRPAG
jgi:hypothetical protein